MDKQQIINEITSYIADKVDRKVTICNEDVYKKKYSYLSFTMKGRKKWLCGLWITELEDKFKIDLFTQYSIFIDKFKPSCSPVSYTLEVAKDKKSITENSSVLDLNLFSFVEDLSKISTSSIGSLIKYYWGTYDGGGRNEGFVKWLISTFLFYRIVEPIRYFFDNQILFAYLCLKKWALKLFFFSWISKIQLVDCNTETLHVSPRFDMTIYLKKFLSTDWTYRIYHIVTSFSRHSNVDIFVLDSENNRIWYRDAHLTPLYDKVRELRWTMECCRSLKKPFLYIKLKILLVIYNIKYKFFS